MEALLSVFSGAGGILGLIGSLGGAIFRFFAEKQAMQNRAMEMAHELAMLDRQADIDERRARLHLDEMTKASEMQLAAIRAQGEAIADVEEIKGISEALKAQLAPTGIHWVDALSASVRPVVTYWWCMCLYTAFKVCLLIALFTDKESPGALLVAQTLITDFDMGIIGSLLGFWFMDRSLRKRT